MLKVAENPFLYYLWFLAFLSVNLGMLQFVPLPLLDGWHILVVCVEKLKGGPLAPKFHIWAQHVGIVLILGLLLYATSNDIMRFFVH
jgi:regulator of sigma E protease